VQYPEKDLLVRDIKTRLYGQLCELVGIFISFFGRERTPALLGSPNQ